MVPAGGRLSVGSNGASMWWLNGEEAVMLEGDRRMVRDDVVSKKLTLKKGRNILRGADNVVSAFAGCNAEKSLIFATMITVLVMLFLYLPRKVVTFKGFMDSFIEGFKLMIPAIGILIFAWTLKGMGDALEIGTFVQNIVGSSASASILLPAILFVVAIFLAFSTGTSWGTFAILVPIAIAMFPGADKLEMMIISVSAVLAGAVCGDHVSPISDTTVMSSAL